MAKGIHIANIVGNEWVLGLVVYTGMETKV